MINDGKWCATRRELHSRTRNIFCLLGWPVASKTPDDGGWSLVVCLTAWVQHAYICGDKYCWVAYKDGCWGTKHIFLMISFFWSLQQRHNIIVPLDTNATLKKQCLVCVVLPCVVCCRRTIRWFHKTHVPRTTLMMWALKNRDRQPMLTVIIHLLLNRGKNTPTQELFQEVLKIETPHPLFLCQGRTSKNCPCKIHGQLDVIGSMWFGARPWG